MTISERAELAEAVLVDQIRASPPRSTGLWRCRSSNLLAVLVALSLSACGGEAADESGGQGTSPRERGNIGEVVTIAGTVETFDRPDDAAGLGTLGGVASWSAEVGTWGVADNQAYASNPVSGRNFAVVDLGQGDGAVEVEVTKVVNAAGLIFRYAGPFDYWGVVPVPGYASWAIFKVVDGKEETVANTGLSAIADGTTVGVRMNGDVIDVILDDLVVRTVVDDTHLDADKVGLTAQTSAAVDAGDSRFDDFRVALPGNEPLPTSTADGEATNPTNPTEITQTTDTTEPDTTEVSPPGQVGPAAPDTGAPRTLISGG